MSFEFVYLISPLGLLELRVQFIWHTLTQKHALFVLSQHPQAFYFLIYQFSYLKSVFAS